MFVMRFVGNFRQASNSSEITATFWLHPKRNFSRLTNHRDPFYHGFWFCQVCFAEGLLFGGFLRFLGIVLRDRVATGFGFWAAVAGMSLGYCWYFCVALSL